MALSKPKWPYVEMTFKECPPKTIKIIVHTIYVSDVEDPEIYLARPLCDWQQTEKGKWVMEHSFPSPSYHCTTDPVRYRHIYNICAYLTEKDYTYYRLKFE